MLDIDASAEIIKEQTQGEAATVWQKRARKSYSNHKCAYTLVHSFIIPFQSPTRVHMQMKTRYYLLRIIKIVSYIKFQIYTLASSWRL